MRFVGRFFLLYIIRVVEALVLKGSSRYVFPTFSSVVFATQNLKCARVEQNGHFNYTRTARKGCTKCELHDG